jgi:hypothetical protein
MSVAEHYARYSRLRSSHASWRLLAATNAPLILAFLTDLFAQVSEVPFSRAKVALEAELLRWKETGVEVQDSASAYLRQWITSGWLREQDGVLLCTDSCEIALRFARGLERRDQSTTASHLRIVQDAVRDLAIAMSPDADARIRALEVQRQALDRDIEELRAGVVVQLSDSEQYERLREVYQLASVLTGDFRRLEDDIRQMDHELRVEMIQADSTRGDVLVSLLKKEGALLDTDAGRAFEGFFQLLADDSRTTEFREQLRSILGRPAGERLRLEERRFLDRLVRELSRESERVLLVRRRAEESLRAYVESNEFRENRAVSRLLIELERRALALRDRDVSPNRRTQLTLPSGRAALQSVESLRLRWPDEAMQIGRVKADSGLREPGDDVLDLLETLKLMTVAGEIIELVAIHGTMTLGDVIAKRPLTTGLEELVACLRVAQAVKAPREEATESVLVMGREGTALRAKIPTYVLTPELLPRNVEDLPL